VFASTTDHNPSEKIVLGDWLRGSDGQATAIVEGTHQPAFTGKDGEQTKIPTASEAEYPWGPWSRPHVVAKAAQYPQLYGAFMTPSFLKDDGKTLYFIMSMFGPYNTFVMKATLVTYD
jgi:hypothetical protein